MKSWYVVVRGHKTGVFKNEAEAKEATKGYYDAKYKGFYSFEEASKYFERYNKNKVDYIYVVNRGKKPGIYERDEVAEQVIGFEGAIVKKFKKENIELAKKFLEANLEVRAKKEKKDPKVTIQAIKDSDLVFKNRYICFLDSEANDNKLISIGATILDRENDEVIGEFYKTCKYKSFVKMDSYCEKISHFTTEQVINFEDFQIVYDSLLKWLASFSCSEVCTWSSTDKSFFDKTLSEYGMKLGDEFKFINIQKKISSETVHLVPNSRWGLSDIKYFYGLDKEVKHHALSDAKDLCNVFIAWKKGSLIEERVLEHV